MRGGLRRSLGGLRGTAPCRSSPSPHPSAAPARSPIEAPAAARSPRRSGPAPSSRRTSTGSRGRSRRTSSPRRAASCASARPLRRQRDDAHVKRLSRGLPGPQPGGPACDASRLVAADRGSSNRGNRRNRCNRPCCDRPCCDRPGSSAATRTVLLAAGALLVRDLLLLDLARALQHQEEEFGLARRLADRAARREVRVHDAARELVQLVLQFRGRAGWRGGRGSSARRGAGAMVK